MCTYTYIYAHIYVWVCVFVCMCVYMYVQKYVCIWLISPTYLETKWNIDKSKAVAAINIAAIETARCRLYILIFWNSQPQSQNNLRKVVIQLLDK